MSHERFEFTQVELLNLLDYNPSTGELVWKERTGLKGKASAWNKRYAGTVAGAMSGNRVNVTIRKVGVDGMTFVKHYRAHNLIWFMQTGHQVPEGFIVDHKDGNGLNNTWGNLRLATNSQNSMNRCVQSNNRSGKTGVRWDSTRGKWKAEIKIGRKCKHIGRFDSFEDAVSARNQYEIELFGEFRRI